MRTVLFLLCVMCLTLGGGLSWAARKPSDWAASLEALAGLMLVGGLTLLGVALRVRP